MKQIKNRAPHPRGMAALLTVVGILVVLGIASVISNRATALQAKQMGKALTGLEAFYAEEMAAISAYMTNRSTSNPPDSTTKLNFKNSTADLEKIPSRFSLPSHVKSSRDTTGKSPSKSTVQNLESLVRVVKKVSNTRQFCGSAKVTGQGIPDASLACLAETACPATIPDTCYDTTAIEQVYHRILGRHPPPRGGQIAWTQYVAKGMISISDTQNALRASAEYLTARTPATCTVSGTTQTYTPAQRKIGATYAEGVTGVYRTLLGRFPTMPELKNGVIDLLGCPGTTKTAKSLDNFIAAIKATPEFTGPNGGTLHAEPVRELTLQMLGRDIAEDSAGFPPDLAALRYWVGNLAGQNPTVNPIVSVAPPFVYGVPSNSIDASRAPYGAPSKRAMFIDEVESNPPVTRLAAGGRVPLGLSEDAKYRVNGGATAEYVIGLYRTNLGRLPAGPYPRDEINYYTKLINPPYLAPLSYIGSQFRASADFAARGRDCGCASIPPPMCRIVPSKTTIITGERVTFTLHVFENNKVDSAGHVNLGSPPSGWNGQSGGTVTSVFWNGNQRLSPGAMTFTTSRVGGAPLTTLSQTAVVGGPGGSSNCSASVQVISPRMTCNIHQFKRGPGAGSRWDYEGNGDIDTPQGPYSWGGVDKPHRFYYDWRVYIPAANASQFDWSTNFRSGAGYIPDRVTAAPVAYGNYDLCNRSDDPNCGAGYTPMPAVFNHLGQNYRLMTRLSDGTPQTYANGGVCGSPDCFCYLSGVASPLIIDFKGEGFKLTPGVYFNMGEGKKNLFWPHQGNDVGFLALDLNHDGKISDFNELFGYRTVGPDRKPASNGFEALMKYKKDDRYVVDNQDPIFSELRIWFDRNHNGKTDGGELVTLPDAGVESIDLYYRNVDEKIDNFGNTIHQSSYVRLKSGSVVRIVDAWFAEGNPQDRALKNSKVAKR